MKSIEHLTIRRPESIEECEQLVDLQVAIWGFNLTDVTPPDLLLLHDFLGGTVLVAYDEDNHPVGFTFSFQGSKEGNQIHWSHMLAVLPEYRGLGLGKKLKFEQRKMIMGQGLSICCWTFDPLEPVNCHLNVVTLGAKVFQYKVNVYGESSGALHSGLPTDRFIAYWELDNRRAIAAEQGKPERIKVDLESAPMLLTVTSRDGKPAISSVEGVSDHEILVCPVPPGMQKLKFEDNKIALKWRLKTRELFQDCFQKGFEILDVKTTKESGDDYFYYIFRRKH